MSRAENNMVPPPRITAPKYGFENMKILISLLKKHGITVRNNRWLMKTSMLMERIQSSPAFIDSLGAIEMERKNIVMQKQAGIINKALSKPQPPTYLLNTIASISKKIIMKNDIIAQKIKFSLLNLAAMPPKSTNGIPKKIPPLPPPAK